MPTSSLVLFVKHNCSSSQKAPGEGNKCLAYFLWSFSMCVIYLFATEKHCVFPAGHRGSVIGHCNFGHIPLVLRLMGWWSWSQCSKSAFLCFWELALFHLSSSPVSTVPSWDCRKSLPSTGEVQGCNEVTQRQSSSENHSETNIPLKTWAVIFFFQKRREFKLCKLSWIMYYKLYFMNMHYVTSFELPWNKFS